MALVLRPGGWSLCSSPFAGCASTGLEHVPRQGGVVLASNHLSMFDTLIIPYSITTGPKVPSPSGHRPRKSCSVCPSPASSCTPGASFPIRRGRNDLRGIRRMLTHMRNGKMMLFPEGTRSRDGRLHEGNRMLGKIIYQAQPVVIPTLIVGTDRVWGASRRWPPLAHARCRCGTASR